MTSGSEDSTVVIPPSRVGALIPPAGGLQVGTLDGLVDLILDTSALNDPATLVERALGRGREVFPGAARCAFVEIRTGGHVLHPASWPKAAGGEPLRKEAVARFQGLTKGILLTGLEPGSVSVMLVPIRTRGRLVGALYLESSPGAAPFSLADLRLASAAAMAVTIGLDNSLLYGELLTSLEFNEGILQGLGSGLLAVDTAGVVRKVNTVGLELLGLRAVDVLRRPLAEIPSLAPLIPLARKVTQTGERLDRQELDLARGEARVPFGITLVPLRTPSGSVDGVIANFRDLTQVHRLAELVRRGQRLAALGEMAAGIAHEIRNPLNSIRGFVELILERTQGEDRRYMQIVVEEVERINHIVGGLLDFSRQQDVPRVPTDMVKVIRRAQALVAASAERARVRLVDLLPERVEVMGHAGKLEQVFLNLLQNAVEAIPQGGEVTVSAECISNGGTAGWAVKVTDTGSGIAPEDLEKLFSPFFTRKERGTGLGLAVCHRILEAHGGRIEVESKQGQGAVFTVWVPS